MRNRKELSPVERKEIINTLKDRFEKNKFSHESIEWDKIQMKLEANTDKLWSVNEMEVTGGEPDVIGFDDETGEYLFYDCATESPKGRRSICYDREALDSRKTHKSKNNAADMASDMGIEILSEEQYRFLQKLGHFDLKTYSWIKTPPEIRDLGGALFADFRYGQVFVYHNSAPSYYASRAFRDILRV